MCAFCRLSIIINRKMALRGEYVEKLVLFWKWYVIMVLLDAIFWRNIMRYTDYKENDLFSSIQFDNGEDDYTDVLNYLNQDFRTFGDGLLALAEKKEGKTIDTPPAYIKQKCKEAGIDISLLGSEPTIRKWFSQDIRPKKGEDCRRKLFVLAFTLGLSVDETKYLFNRV